MFHVHEYIKYICQEKHMLDKVCEVMANFSMLTFLYYIILTLRNGLCLH